jgi:hypothetical protein
MKRGLNQENSLPDPEFGGESSESARAIHYVVQKDTLMTYVSALIAQADLRKLRGSTIERKQMSTKTIYKRIALVAVASLGAGVLSVAPANAVVPTLFKITVAESIGTDTDTAVTVSGASNYVDIESKVDATGGATVRVDLTGATFVDITETVAGTDPDGAGATDTTTAPDAAWSYNVAATVASSSSNNIYGAKTGAGTAGVQKLRINTATAGTVTAKVYEVTISSGVATSTLIDTLTITVNAAATAGVLSVAKSTSLLDADATAGGSYSAPSADETVTVSKAQGTAAGVARLTLNDANTQTMPTTTVKAVVTGPGLVSLNSTLASATVATAGRDVSGTTSSGVINAAFYADGVEGTSVITFTVGTTVVATETVKYYGAPTKYTATTNIVALANTTPSTDAVTVCAADAASIAVPGHTIYAFSGDTTVATVEANDATETAGSAVATATGTSYSDHVEVTPAGCVGFTVTGLAQTTKSSVVITFGNASTLAASTVTTTATVNVGLATADSVVLTANKATYAPGEAMTLTLTFKDANGRLIAYGPGTGTLAAELVSSVSTVGTKFGTANKAKLGTTTATVYAPLAAGPLVISGTTAATAGSYLTATNISKPVTVSVAIAAPASVDSANIAALTTLVNSLIAKINALNKLVIKIQKKVRA